MKRKRLAISSIALAALIFFSLFAVASSPAVSGQESGTTAPLATNPVGATMAGTGPAASSSFATRETEIFAVDPSGGVWNTSIAPSGNGTWTPLGGVSTASPAAVSWNASYPRIDVFVRGTNGSVYQKYWSGSAWSKWGSLGGKLASGTGPAVSSWSAGRLDVFVQGTDSQLWHKWWNGASWSGWESLGGKLTASPAATSPSIGVIDVFARGSDGGVWQKSYNKGWSSWKSLGGQVAVGTGPAVSQDLWLFVQGTDHQLLRTGVGVGSAKSTGWSILGGRPSEALSTSSPGAVVLSTGQTLVCVSSTSGNVWFSADSLANWKDWGSAADPPVVIHRPELSQGIANDGTYNYGMSTTALYKYDSNWNLITTNGNAATRCGGNHIGSGGTYNGVLYVLCTENAPAPELAHVGLFRTSDLSFIKMVNLATVAGSPPTADQMNIGGVGVNPDAGLLLGLSFGPYGGAALTNASVFTFNLTTFAYEGSFQASDNPTIANQGISYYGGHYYYAYDNPGGVAIMNTDGSNATQIISASKMMAGGGTDEIEGLSVTNSNVYVLRGGYLYMFPFQAA